MMGLWRAASGQQPAFFEGVSPAGRVVRMT